MKVKIGNKIYDSTEQPIMLIFSSEEKGHIASMLPDKMMYCSAPYDMQEDEIRKFMEMETSKYA